MNYLLYIWYLLLLCEAYNTKEEEQRLVCSASGKSVWVERQVCFGLLSVNWQNEDPTQRVGLVDGGHHHGFFRSPMPRHMSKGVQVRDLI
jgi:hypothetical protein